MENADDLKALYTAACALAANACALATWLDLAIRPLVLSLPDQTPENLFGDLPGEVDRGIVACETMLGSLRHELTAPEDAVRELAALLLPARVTCPGCNRIRFDIAKMLDEHKVRALALFRAARGSES
ncbi:unnamed protein product [Gemmata massiliana]|uniref:Uncharacterized protein n=1 Tax=Gemmata massiliana TaxID=1210884 RepID=A0A6P2CWB6_9BACT|nr:unnamed protein product [Gemmata massiliana]